MSQRLELVKAHGLGNDFLLLVDPDAVLPFEADVARSVCDRHRGVGGDGLIRISQPEGGWRMDVRNADGGVAEISGNGLRCVALLLADRGLVPPVFVLDTGAGPRPVEVDVASGSVVADMGEPGIGPVPSGPAAAGLDMTALSLGNPHVVVFVADPASVDLHVLGPALESDPSYPARTNVELVAVLDPMTVRARIWERGVGETQSSGTGGSACAVAARMRGLVERMVKVELPGGTLEVTWDGPGSAVRMAGPARLLFTVDVDLDALG